MKFSPIEGERQCTRCLQCKPVSEFRQRRDGRRRGKCKDCERSQSLRRYHATKGDRGSRLWQPTDDEIAIIRQHYPDGGSAAVMARMPGRSRGQIQSAASQRGIRYTGPTVSGGNTKYVEPAWAVPAHDYCEADLALRQWGVPGMGRAVPELGTPVGVLSPSLGLVMGVAA